MSTEDEYELNFLKIDCNNNVKLIATDDYELEMLDLMACVSPFEQESIDGILLKFFKKFLPSGQDIVQINIEISKKYIKLVHSEKKVNKIIESINRILSIDFRDTFIFNNTNIQDITNIMANGFNDIKKYKISNYAELKEALQKLNFNKYKVDKLYLNTEYINKKFSNLSRGNSIKTVKTISSSGSCVNKENNGNLDNEDNSSKNLKIQTKYEGITHIDNNIKNVINSSMLNYIDYNQETTKKITLTKDCFNFQKNSKEDCELPIELIILLYKLRKVKTLVYQINNVDEVFFKNVIFILMNVKWLFMGEIEEVKFDLGNEDLQKGIIGVFNERSSEIYSNFHKTKNIYYYNGSYKARTINLWEPEGDIFFNIIETKQNDDNNENKNNRNNYIYSEQPNTEGCFFGNQLCNIYNEHGNITNLKYIKPIKYIFKNNDNDNIYEQDIEEEENIEYYLNENFKRPERESVYLNTSNSLISKNSLNQSTQNATNNTPNIIQERTTPTLLKEFVKDNLYSFKMVAFYSYFFTKELKKIKKLGIYFHTPYFYETQLMLRLYDIPYDRFHFLILANSIDTLTEAEFSFNSLDNKSFENIMGIINKNSNLTSLKMSFFTPDINYLDNSLFHLWSSKKLSIRKIFNEQKEFLINCTGDKEREMNYFILHHNKFIDSISKNLRNFFNLLKVKTLNNLEELIFRFDLPLSILNSEKYIILLTKFIINILIMITFQDNHIHTLKLISPQLPFNSVKMPFIRQLFREILLEGESIDEKWEEKVKSEKKRKEKIRIKEKEKELKEQIIRENELKEKNARKDLLQSISNVTSGSSTKEVIRMNDKELENENEKEFNIDVDENLEQFDYSKRFRSVFHKKKFSMNIEKEVRRKETMSSDKLEEQLRQLNKNVSLENIIIQFKIYNLPEIFNICLINNLRGLKSINFGYLDEITFTSFLKDYKLNCDKLVSLKSLKISLCASVISYSNLESHIIDYINTNSPSLEEKFLFSDLKIVYESKMKELVELVYFKAEVPKLIIQIGNDNDNVHLLSKVNRKIIQDRKTVIYSLIMLMELPEYKQLYTMNIIECLGSFYAKKLNKAILCKENPNNN